MGSITTYRNETYCWVLNLMVKEPERKFTASEFFTYTRGQILTKDLKQMVNEGYIREISDDRNDVTYQITSKGMQFRREYYRGVILARITVSYARKKEYTIRGLMNNEKILKNDFKFLYSLLETLCQDGYLTKNHISTEIDQLDVVYKITSKSRRKGRRFNFKYNFQRKRKKIKKIKGKLQENTLLNIIVTGFVYIVGGLILIGIIWGLILLFT